jgi:hypothetical protein
MSTEGLLWKFWGVLGLRCSSQLACGLSSMTATMFSYSIYIIKLWDWLLIYVEAIILVNWSSRTYEMHLLCSCDILAPKDSDILAQDLIELIEYSYQQGTSSFSEAYLERTSRLSVLGLEQFGMGDQPRSLLGCAWVRIKCAQKTRVGL